MKKYYHFRVHAHTKSKHQTCSNILQRTNTSCKVDLNSQECRPQELWRGRSEFWLTYNVSASQYCKQLLSKVENKPSTVALVPLAVGPCVAFIRLEFTVESTAASRRVIATHMMPTPTHPRHD